MRVAEFCLVNEKGQEFSLMDEMNYCLITEVTGLGCSYTAEYQQLGNIFIEILRKIEQGKIDGSAKFRNYDNYKKFIDYVESSEKLKFLYSIPFYNGQRLTYLKDVSIQNISGGIIINEDERLISTVTFNCLSLWYQDKETVYTIEKIEGEIQWDFRWDARFSDYTSRSIIFSNDGHVEAPFQVEMDNYLINPGFYIMKDGVIINSLKIPITIQQGEKLLYSSKDNEIYIKKQNIDGSFENLFKHDYIDLNNNNIFKVPKGTTEIVLTADNEIFNAKLNIFKQYEVV